MSGNRKSYQRKASHPTPNGLLRVGQFNNQVILGGGREHLHTTYKEEFENRAWFRKEHLDRYTRDQNNTIAQHEVFAQELFRAFIPACPTTALVTDNKYGKSKYYAASQGINLPKKDDGFHNGNFGFNHLRKDKEKLTELSNRFLDDPDNRFTGLGNVLVMCLLMNETDLRLANFGVDEENRVVKIDGDRSFMRLRPPTSEKKMAEDANKYQITATLLDNLPGCDSYGAMNWLDHKKGNRIKPHPAILLDGKRDLFNTEINEALLKAILMPPELFEKLADNIFIDAEVKKSCLAEIKDRQQQMKKAAMSRPEFQDYLNSDAAFEVAKSFSAELGIFKMVGGESLTNKQYSFEKEINTLREQIPEIAPIPFPTIMQLLNNANIIGISNEKITLKNEVDKAKEKNAPPGAYIIRPGDKEGTIDLRIIMKNNKVENFVCKPIIENGKIIALQAIQPKLSQRINFPLKEFTKGWADSSTVSSTETIERRLSSSNPSASKRDSRSASSTKTNIDSIIEFVQEYENDQKACNQKAHVDNPLTKARNLYAKLNESEKMSCDEQLNNNNVTEKTIKHLKRTPLALKNTNAPASEAHTHENKGYRK